MRPRLPLLNHLAALAATLTFSRPGAPLPASNAPYSSAPAEGAARAASPRRLRRSLEASVAEGIVAEVVTACSGGAVMTAWAIHVGCGPFLIGVLGSLSFVAQLVQFPAAWVTSRFGGRRTALVAVSLSRQALLPLVVLPFLGLPLATMKYVLLAVSALSAVLGVVGNNAWVAWMGDLVPETLRGRYFGRRTAFLTLGGTLASLAAGLLLDAARARGQEGAMLGALGLAACVSGAITTALMARQHEPARLARRDLDFSAALQPLGDARAKKLLGYQIAWNASVGLASAFYSVHMLQNLGMGFTLMALQAAAVAAVRMLTAPLWGRAIDRVGARPVLVACSFGITLIPVLWLTPRRDFLLPVCFDALLSGTLWAGHALASFNLPLAIAPQRGRPFYLAAFSTAGGLAYAAASAAGGALAQSLPGDLLLFGVAFVPIHVLFALSALARLFAARLALNIEEPRAQGVSALGRLLKQAVAPS